MAGYPQAWGLQVGAEGARLCLPNALLTMVSVRYLRFRLTSVSQPQNRTSSIITNNGKPLVNSDVPTETMLYSHIIFMIVPESTESIPILETRI